jgi:hypothetical protein
MTWLTQLRISTSNYPIASGSLQCLSALRRLHDLEIDDEDYPGSRTGLSTAPPLSYCTALTRLGCICVSTEVQARKCIRTVLNSLLFHCVLPGMRTEAIAIYGAVRRVGWYFARLQALLPCIAQLSGLPLRELEMDVQQFPNPAAYLAPFQRLPRTLRQLQLKSTVCYEYGVNPERTPLPPGLLPARVQTTALRQVQLDDMLAGSGCRTVTSTQHRGVLNALSGHVLVPYGIHHVHAVLISRTTLSSPCNDVRTLGGQACYVPRCSQEADACGSRDCGCDAG